MSVEIETSALSTFESLDSLRATPLVMHRIQLELHDVKTWYAVIRELNQVYGTGNWKGQSHVKRRLENIIWNPDQAVRVWFDVPDPAFATWVSVKHSVIARVQATK